SYESCESHCRNFPQEFVVSALFQRLEENENFQRLVNEACAGKPLLRIAGVSSGAKALALVALQRAIGRRLAVVSLRDSDLEDLERDLRFFYCHLHDRPECENEIFILPASESDPYSGASPHAEILERRALALWRFAAGGGGVGVGCCMCLLGVGGVGGGWVSSQG